MTRVRPFPSLQRSVSRFAAGLLISALATVAFAGEGHGHDESAPAAGGTAHPRMSAHSDLFELVGVVDKGQMTVYLDRYATNEPVTGARIEYESGSNKGVAQPQADGTYLVKFEALTKPGELPFSFTVTAGADTDLLAGDLHLEDPHAAHPEEGSPMRGWLVGAAGVVAALAFAFVLRRKLKKTGGARLKVWDRS